MMFEGLLADLANSFDPTSVFVRVLAAFIGLGYLSYGKKHNIWYALCGLGLLLYPYFINTTFQLFAIGLGLLIAPIILSRLL